MKCPYCAENINEEAVFCHHCNHDLSFFLPLQRELNSLKERVSSVERSFSEPTSTQDHNAEKPRWVRIGLACFLAGTVPVGISTYILADLVLTHHFLSYESYKNLLFVFHLLPLPFGLWAGLEWPRGSWRGYAFTALLAGWIELNVNLLFGQLRTQTTYLSMESEDFIAILATFTLFISGGLFANLWKTRKQWRERWMPKEGGRIEKTTVLLIRTLGPPLLSGIGGALVKTFVGLK